MYCYAKSQGKGVLGLTVLQDKMLELVLEGLLTVGNLIPMMNNQGGIIPGKVLEVKEDVVVMDFNHQMAGKELHFVGEILTVREATQEELTDGLHGEFKQQGGCSGCSGCGDGGSDCSCGGC